MFDAFDVPTIKVGLRLGRFSAEVWPELGGSIAGFWHEDRALFRPTPANQRYRPIDLASFPLVPYSNRIANGRFRVTGRSCALPRNFPGFAHPLHGIGWIRPWTITDQQADGCSMRLEHSGDDHWPWAFTATQRVSLTPNGLQLQLRLRNDGEELMPYGLGQHPYIARPPGTRIRAPVSGVWLCNTDQLPIEHRALPERWNLPAGVVLDDCFVDNCFDGLDGDVRVHWPDGSGLCIRTAPSMRFLVVYSLPEGNFVCIEPVSQRPDAFNASVGDAAAAGVCLLAPRASALSMQNFDFIAAARRSQGSRLGTAMEPN